MTLTPSLEGARQGERQAAAYEADLVRAWLDTRLERDRSLLTLASGGIGLLVTLLSAKGANNALAQVLYGAAFLAFLSTIFSTFCIFHRNSTYLEHLLSGGTGEDRWLRTLDRFAVGGFGVGVLAAVGIGLTYL